MSYLNDFLTHYISCALWSSSDDSGKGEYLDSNYSREDISPATESEIKEDCKNFIDRANDLLKDIDVEQAGHDFWLTRNGHGAGFWDRGLGEIGDKLTEICKEFGECNLYIGDDGKIYLM